MAWVRSRCCSSVSMARSGKGVCKPRAQGGFEKVFNSCQIPRQVWSESLSVVLVINSTCVSLPKVANFFKLLL